MRAALVLATFLGAVCVSSAAFAQAVPPCTEDETGDACPAGSGDPPDPWAPAWPIESNGSWSDPYQPAGDPPCDEGNVIMCRDNYERGYTVCDCVDWPIDRAFR